MIPIPFESPTALCSRTVGPLRPSSVFFHQILDWVLLVASHPDSVSTIATRLNVLSYPCDCPLRHASHALPWTSNDSPCTPVVSRQYRSSKCSLTASQLIFGNMFSRFCSMHALHRNKIASIFGSPSLCSNARLCLSAAARARTPCLHNARYGKWVSSCSKISFQTG